MKYVISVLVSILCSANIGIALPTMKTTFHVVDAETGLPITNAIIKKSFVLDHDWSGSKTRQEEFKVDTDGFCTFSGETHLISGGGAAVVADGYYRDSGANKFSGCNKILNRWEPWNPTIDVKMRPIKNPVPMVQKSVEWELIIPKYNTPIGMDLAKGDWVQPYGGGIVSDMLIEINPLNPAEKGSQCRITFPNPLDGIQEYEFQWPTSEFKWPYLAPTNGYSNVLEKFYVLNFPKVDGAPEHTLKKEVNYIIRTRTKVDDEGQLVSACYGYFPGEINFIPKGEFKFVYYFNPVPNERSLEYSGENLLKK